MESGEGENFEKCSICLGTLAKAAFFIINRTNFIIAAGSFGSWPPRPTVDDSSNWPSLLSCSRGENKGGTSLNAARDSQ